MKNLFRKIKKYFIFLFGDIRREHCLLGFAWGKKEPLISKEEAIEGVSVSKPGFIGLHRNAGDLSNTAIGGCFKHAWLHVHDSKIVEAVSEGVLLRHALYPLDTDYAVLLEPIIDKDALDQAVERVLTIVGTAYDDTFSFDLEREDEIFKDKVTALDNMKQYGLGVSCTETVALGFVGHRKELGLFRVKEMGKLVIMPDNYMTTHFKVVWASKSMTVEQAKAFGLPEEGCSILQDYWDCKK